MMTTNTTNLITKVSSGSFIKPSVDWPPEVANLFTPVCPIGKGCFGGVWSANMNQKAQKLIGENDTLTFSEVAVKRINIATPYGKDVASREIKLLKNLYHPNIIHLIQAFDFTNSNFQFVVMNLADGPSMYKVLNKGGALRLNLVQLISQHLISALSYMHTRGVIYRDLKPDNVIVVGAVADNMSIFHYDSVKDESNYISKCQAIIVDLGLARPLTKEKLDKELNHHENKCCSGMLTSFISLLRPEDQYIGQDTQSNPLDDSHSKTRRLSLISRISNEVFRHRINNESRWLDLPLKTLPQSQLSMETTLENVIQSDSIPSEIIFNSSKEPNSDDWFESAERSFALDKMNFSDTCSEQCDSVRSLGSARSKSFSRRGQRLSIVGSKAYSAPEVAQNIVSCYKDTRNVSEYGMLADAFSLGCVIREMITGAPPFLSVQEMKSIRSRHATQTNFNIRPCHFVPYSAVNLIKQLTRKETKRRITIRSAQTHPYISNAKSLLPHADIPTKEGDPIVYIE